MAKEDSAMFRVNPNIGYSTGVRVWKRIGWFDLLRSKTEGMRVPEVWWLTHTVIKNIANMSALVNFNWNQMVHY